MTVKFITHPDRSFIDVYDIESLDVLEEKGLKYFFLKWPEYKVKNLISIMKDSQKHNFYVRSSKYAIQMFSLKDLKRIVKYYPENDLLAAKSRENIINAINQYNHNECTIN